MIATMNITEALDRACVRLEETPDEAAAAVEELAGGLNEIRRSVDDTGWEAAVRQCREHRVLATLHEDPLADRSFRKPRGYSGDPGLLDMIYACDWRGVCRHPVTPRGEAIFGCTINRRAAAAVRVRRGLLAGVIDDASAIHPSRHILAVGCGHLRELRLSAAFREGRIGRFVGLDRDRAGLALAVADWPAGRIETVAGTFRQLFNGKLAAQRFDLIYVPGLFDCLDMRRAQYLTRRLFQMLRPHGRLVIANFRPELEDTAYLEAVMDWRLHCRDSVAMAELTLGLPESSCRWRVFDDPSRTLVFLQVDRVP